MASTAVVYRLIARDNASRVFNNVGRSAQRLQTTSEKVGAALKAGLTVGAIATAGLGASVIKMAGDFEKNMNRVEALSGATGKQLTKLRDQAKDLGRTTQYSAAQSADAMAQLATAGLGVNQIYGAMPSVLSLASSEQLDLTRAAEITTSVLTGYGMKINEIPHAVDAMVKASVKANTSVDDLGEAFKYSGPIAHQAGVKFEEAAAATALMGNAGIKASMAGTALRGAVTRLLAPTDKISGTLEDLGVNVATADGKLRPLHQIVGELAKSGATTGQIMTIFGQRAGPGMAALIQQGSDKLVGLTKELENSGGTADRISKIQMKGWRGEVIRLRNAWEGLMIAIGDSGVLTVATKALSGITRATTGFANWVTEKGIPAAQSFKRFMGNLVPVGDIKQNLGEAKSAVADFFAGLSGKGMKNISMPRVDKMPEIVPKSQAGLIGQQIHDAIQSGFKDIDWGNLGSILGKGLSDAIGWVGKHAADFGKKIAGILGKIDFVDVGKAFGGAAIPLAIGFITNLFAPLFSLDFWKKHWLDTIIAVLSVIPIGRLASGLGKVFKNIPFLKVFEPLLRGIGSLGGFLEKGLGKFVLKPLGRFAKAVWEGIVKGFVRVFPGSAGKLGQFIDNMALNILGYVGRFAAAGERLIKGLGSGLLKVGGRIGEWIGRVVGWLVKPFARAGSWLIGKGRAVVTGLKDGVVTAAKAIGSWAWRTIVQPVLSRFTSAASWLLTRGRSIVSGLKAGAVAGARAIGSWAVRTIITPVLSRFTRAGSWLITRGKSVVSGLKSGIVGGARAIGSWTNSRVISPVTGAFRAAGTWLRSKGGALISGLKDGIVGAVKGIGHWIKSNLIDPVVNAVKSFFGIHSPSTVFAEIGGHLVGGLFKGLATTSGTVLAKKVFGDLPHALSSIVSKGLVSIGRLPKKALDALASVGGAIGLGDSSVKGGAQQYAQLMLKAYGWGPAQWPALKALWMGESGWNPLAHNASSGAHGIPQSLPASKMASEGSDYLTNPQTQIRWGLKYIKSRYGSPAAAYGAWQARSPHWYAAGTGGAAKGLAWVGEKGPELVNFRGGEDVLSHQQSMLFAKSNGIKLPGYASGTISNAADRYRRARDRVEDARDKVARAKRRHKGVQAAERELEAAKKQLEAAKISLANARRSAKVSISNTLATGFLKKIETGSSSAIASAIKSISTKLLNAGFDRLAKSVLKKGDRLEKLADQRASVQKRLAQARRYATDQAASLRESFSVTGTSATTVGGLISEMRSKQAEASTFASQVKWLKGRGLSKDLLGQLAEAGPGSELARLLASANKGQIAQLNKLAKSGQKLSDSYGRSIADAMFDSGKQAGKGFLAGLKAQEKALQKQINKLATSLVKEIKKALKIKSPSGVFRDEIGKQVVLGMVHGIDLHTPLVGAAAQRMADTASGITMRRRYVPTAASGRNGGHRDEELWERLAAALEATGQDVHVHFNDDRLRDLIDVQVKPKIKASEQSQAHRARRGRRA